MKTKTIMRLSDLRNVKAELVAKLALTGYLRNPKTPGDEASAPTADLTRPGFYFLVHENKATVFARYFVGRQRSKSGFANVASQIRALRSKTSETIMDERAGYFVYFMPIEAMKPLTTGFMKGKFALFLTRSHNDRFQNIEEMNRMLNDNFKFFAQKY